MVSGLPDYTKYIAPQVTITEPERPFGSKAETVAKLSVSGKDPCPSVMLSITPSAGKKIGLILVGFTVRNGGNVSLDVYNGGAWETKIDEFDVAAGQPAILPLFCWEPAMDVGDGTITTVRLVGPSGANKSGFILYYEYTP